MIPLDFYKAVVDQFVPVPGANTRVSMCAAQCCRKLKSSSEKYPCWLVRVLRVRMLFVTSKGACWFLVLVTHTSTT